MFLHNRPGEIQLLPALPSEWSDGHIIGLKGMGNVTVDIYFAGGKLTKAVIRANDERALPVKVSYNGQVVAVIEKTGVTELEL